MQKKFLGNLLFIIVLNLLIKPFYVFGIDIQVQNLVGPEKYGLYFSLLSFSFLFNMILDIGITNYNTNNTAQSPHSIEKYLGSFIGLKLMMALIYIFITFGTALAIGYSTDELYLLRFFILNQILAGLILYLRSNFAGLHLFKVDAILSVLDRLLLIIMTAAFIYGGLTKQAFKIEWFVYMQTIAYATTFLIGLVITRVKIGQLKLKVRKVLSLTILRRSFPFALLILLMMLYTRIDSVMIERMLPNGKVQAGIYAQGFRLLDAVNTFAFLVAGLLFPIFSRMIWKKESVKPVLQLSANLLIGVAVVVSIVVAMHSQFIISFVYTHDTQVAGDLFFWLILSFIPIAFTHIFSTLLTANKNLKLLNIMAVCGIFTNIGLNLILIPIFQAKGAAIATIFTQSVTAILQVIFVLRVFKFSIHWASVVRFGTLTVGIIASILLFKTYFDPMKSFLFSLCFGGTLLLLLKLVKIKDFLALLKTKIES